MTQRSMMMLKEQFAEIKELLNEEPAATEETTDVIEPEKDTDPVVVEPEEEPADDAEPEVVAESEETEEPGAETALEEDGKYLAPELAKSIGWEESEIYERLLIPLQDGSTVPLGDFKNKHQDVVHENEQLKTQLEQAKTVEGSAAQSQQLSQEMITLAGNLDQVNRVEAGTDWDELEQIDPTEAVLKRDKIRRARDEVQQAMNELQGKESAAYETYVQQQGVKMVELMPDWKDSEARDKDQGAIRANMIAYGFTDNEINTIIDPRQMQMMNDFTKLKAKAETALKAVKTVRKAPRVLNSNRNVSKGDPQSAVDKLVNKATRSGDRKLEQKAIKALLEGKV